jgi:hypothetical protein
MHQGATQPIRYRVVVRGHLGRTLADAFDHLELDSSGGESSLTGTVADQAQLHGLLDRLRDLGIAVVSVNPVTDDPPQAPTTGGRP